MKSDLKLYSFNIPGLGRILVISSDIKHAAESAENYFRCGLSVSNMKQFAKKLTPEKTKEFLNGAVIGEDGIFNSQSKLKEEYEQFLEEV